MVTGAYTFTVVRLIPTFSPQGDGNAVVYHQWDHDVWVIVDPYLFPARGRKPHAGGCFIKQWRRVDPYLFPARGRKPHLS